MIYSTHTAHIQKSAKYFLLAFGLLNILSFTLLLCGLSLLAGITISKWQLPVATLLALIVQYFAARFFKKEGNNISFVRNSAFIIGLLAFFILFCGYFYDVSFDGQWYHQETVFRLQQGYNPVYQLLQVPADEVLFENNNNREWCTGADKPVSDTGKQGRPIVNAKYLTINHFSKGSEIIEAAFYALTNRIETGKAVNGITLAASFFLCLSLLYRIERVSIIKKWLLAIIVCFNPVTVIQLLTFCVDGNLGSVLLCLLLVLCLLFINANRYYLFLLGALLPVVVNIKFTSLVYAGIFCTAYLIILLVYKKTKLFRQVFALGMLSALVGIFCCGFNPYVNNLIERHNMFYGVAETQHVIDELTPPLFKGMNRFEKLALSLSAHQGWHSADKSSVGQIPKIPFTFNKEDIRDSSDAEQQLSGFGPFFSGALLVAILLLVVYVIQLRQMQPFKLAMAVFFIILLTVFIAPVCWWARYVPQLWLLPVIILFIAELLPTRGIKLPATLLYLSLGLNVAWALLSIPSDLFITVHANYQLSQLRELHQPVKVQYCRSYSYKSNKIRLSEHGIPYEEHKVSGPFIYNVIASNTRIETAAPLPELPKPFLMRAGEKINRTQ